MRLSFIVMAGPEPAIYSRCRCADGRVKPGHDVL
jgi:hypothetical protein